jgi:hypothetical protein
MRIRMKSIIEMWIKNYIKIVRVHSTVQYRTVEYVYIVRLHMRIWVVSIIEIWIKNYRKVVRVHSTV